MQQSNKSLKKNFEQPDERRTFEANGHLDLINFEDGTSIGRALFKPGWKWSNDVKPIAQTQSCEAAHTGYCVSGSMVVQMNSGEKIYVKAGDAFHIPPGHDAWVEGKEPCVMLDFMGFANYAKKAA